LAVPSSFNDAPAFAMFSVSWIGIAASLSPLESTVIVSGVPAVDVMTTGAGISAGRDATAAPAGGKEYTPLW